MKMSVLAFIPASSFTWLCLFVFQTRAASEEELSLVHKYVTNILGIFKKMNVKS